jgi:hypothetical protein
MLEEKKKDPIYFTMKMPDWFIELEGAKKIEVIEKLAEDSDAHTLTEAELCQLMFIK